MENNIHKDLLTTNKPDNSIEALAFSTADNELLKALITIIPDGSSNFANAQLPAVSSIENVLKIKSTIAVAKAEVTRQVSNTMAYEKRVAVNAPGTDMIKMGLT